MPNRVIDMNLPQFLYYSHIVLSFLIVASSFVQVVQNFGRRMAATIYSGSPNMWLKQFFNPIWGKNLIGINI